MRYLLTLTCLVIACISVAQTTLPENVRTSVEKRIAAGQNHSIAIGIIDSLGMHYFSFGVTHDGGMPVDEHTIYEIGSISKTFTGILLAQMHLQGLVSVDDPAQKYLPSSVKLPTYDGEQITLGHLSDHTSSLPRMPDNFNPADPMNPYTDYSVEQMYAFLNGCTLTREIGSDYEYSNLAQGLLGHILALAGDTDYETLVQLVIAAPLEMQETAIELSQKMRKRLARPHARGVEVSNWDIPTLAGAGAIRSSVHDMLYFLGGNMGMIETPIYPAMEMSHQPRHDRRGVGVGLGWHIANGSEGPVVWHNGKTGGYTAFAGFVKETGRGVVVLTNSDSDCDDIGFHLLNPSSPLREIKPHIAALLRETIDKEGVPGIEEKFAEWKKKYASTHDFGEFDINALGYYYLGRQETDAALAIFKINTEEYPTSSNVWDSYGEAFMIKGDTAAAIENYRKSLEINPGNVNGIEMLRTMGVEYQAAEVKVAEEILDSYLGVYELMPGFNITITREGAQLMGQATGQSSFEMFPRSETEYYLKVVDAQIVFNLNDEGAVESLTLFQGGQEIVGVKQ